IRELGATPIDYQRENFTRVLPGGFDGVAKDGWRFARGARARWAAVRLRLHGGRAAAAQPAPYVDVADAPVFPVSFAAARQRQAHPHLRDQRDAGAASHLVSGGSRAAL